MERREHRHESTPFGNPDGSRAQISEIIDGFVIFKSSHYWGGLATSETDRSARVIVGKKGSGKTVYLRRLQAFAVKQEALYADPIQQDVPSTENVITFSQFFPEALLTEKWMVLWRRAIMRSLLSHLRHNNQLKKYVDSQLIDNLTTNYPQILRNFGQKLSIYSQVREIIGMFNNTHDITKFLDNPLWDELEAHIVEMLRTCPPIFFYIDAVDEEFAHAPSYWLRCQKGLFYETMRLLRDVEFGERIHLIIAIRDITLASVYRSEHETRYRGEPHIKFLRWGYGATQYFLREKVAKLDDTYFTNQSSDKTISSWLGIQTISNTTRQIEEPVEQYLIRHTRCLPRDIVRLGNSLCEALKGNNAMGKPDTVQEIVRRVTAENAVIAGNEQLIQCGNHLSSDLTPTLAGLRGYSEVYTADQEYIGGMTDKLREFIKLIGKEQFSYNDLKALRSRQAEFFGGDVDSFTVLWLNGLLGYCNSTDKDEQPLFFSEYSLDDFNLPTDASSYVFHTCVTDALGLKISRNWPFIPRSPR